MRLKADRFAGIALCVLLIAAGGARADEYEAGELQVELAPGASIGAINARYGTATLDSLPPLYLLNLPEDAGETELLDQMEGDPDILEAEYSWENETPEGTRQMTVIAVGGTIDDYEDQGLVERLRIPEAHQHTQGEGILVAVIDSGVLASHPALAGMVELGIDFVDNDDDATDGANGVDDDGDGDIDEGAGHGTMVAGIIHLMAPQARILPIRVLDDEGRGKTFSVAKAIRYAAGHGAQVINLSLGLESNSWVIGHEIDRAYDAGTVMVGAAGNGGVESALYPARDNDVLCVAGLDSADVKADFSNWGSSVDLSAPSLGVLAPYHDGGYAIGAGTSFAAPFIAGQVALVLATNPDLPLDETYSAAQQGIVDINDLEGNEPFEGKLGSGRVDAYETWFQTPVAGVATPEVAAASLGITVAPNPTRAGHPVAIRWRGTGLGPTHVSIFDASGRRLRTLAVSHDGSLTWDGRDTAGRRAAAGIYFIRMGAPGGTAPAMSRLVLLDR